MKRSPLGTIRVDRFLRSHWQKKPLLLRAAMPEIRELFRADDMLALAGRDDVESRVVMRSRRRWNVAHGPFNRRFFSALPATDWTLLVQGVDTHLTPARALVSRFDFIPYARHDDLMVSVAPRGGGVGPHFDSYDVFLLQARGRRRWRLGKQTDLRLVEGAPLKILRRFTPSETIDVEPGDLLYLPPNYAHDGIAQDDCITCSIGFRAPTAQQLGVHFLQWLQDELHTEGRYADPALRPQRDPARIARSMQRRAEQMLAAIRWQRRDVARFLGEYLTEPKTETWFERPPRALRAATFAARLRRRGIRLSLKTRMLFDQENVYINGERVPMPLHARSALKRLANQRALEPGAAAAVCGLLHAWYQCGYVELV